VAYEPLSSVWPSAGTCIAINTQKVVTAPVIAFPLMFNSQAANASFCERIVPRRLKPALYDHCEVSGLSVFGLWSLAER
jgi:hypothetical protein